MKYWAPALERKMCEYSLLINERKIENGNRNVPHCCMYYEVAWVDLGLPRCLCIFFNTAYPPFFGVWEMITQTTSQLIQLKKNTTICFFSWTINNAKTFQFSFRIQPRPLHNILLLHLEYWPCERNQAILLGLLSVIQWIIHNLFLFLRISIWRIVMRIT